MKRMFFVLTETRSGDQVNTTYLVGNAPSPSEAAAEAARTLIADSPHVTLRHLAVHQVSDELVREAASHLTPVAADPAHTDAHESVNGFGHDRLNGRQVRSAKQAEYQSLLDAMAAAEAAAAETEAAEDREDKALEDLSRAIRTVYPNARDGSRVRIGGRPYEVCCFGEGCLTLSEVDEAVAG